MKNSLPHSRLISVAAELVRKGVVSLGEREASLPKWAQAAIEGGFDRQRELAVVIRENADQLFQELVTAQETIEQLKARLLEWERDAEGFLEVYRSPEEKEIMRIIDEKY